MNKLFLFAAPELQCSNRRPRKSCGQGDNHERVIQGKLARVVSRSKEVIRRISRT